MNQSKYSACLFIDFKKAFDCVSHPILLKKCKKLGFNTQIVLWLENYLTNRLQSVRANDIISPPLNVTHGVPQGSVLGPILFKIYINDVSSLPFSSKLILYADDLVLYSSSNCIETAMRNLQNDLDMIKSWTQLNKLTINAKKSKYLIIGTPRMLNRINPDLYQLGIGGISLDRVRNYEYLGIIIDEYLNFEKALNAVYSKVNNKLYLLGLIRKYLTRYSAIRLFKALAMPYMEYAYFILGACNDKSITKLQRLQNRGMRICLKSTRLTPTSILHEQCKMLTVRNKMILNTLKVMNRRIHRAHCPDRNSNIRATRSNRAPLFIEIFPLSARFQKSLCGWGYQLWNRLPADARATDDPAFFSRRLKLELLQDQLHPHG